MTAVPTGSPQATQSTQEGQTVSSPAPKAPAKKSAKSSKPKAPKVKKAQVPASHPPYIQVFDLKKLQLSFKHLTFCTIKMIKKALGELKDKKGASKPAILKYIDTHYNLGGNKAHVRNGLSFSKNFFIFRSMLNLNSRLSVVSIQES